MGIFTKPRARAARTEPRVPRRQRSIYDYTGANELGAIYGPDGTRYEEIVSGVSGLSPPDSSVLRAMWGLRSASRSEWAKGSHLRAAVLTFRREVVGAGLALRCQHKDQAVRDAVEAAWKRWAKRPDVTGQMSWRLLLQRIVANFIIDGEAVLLEHQVDGAYKLELIDPVRLNIDKNDETTTMGIEVDDLRRPTGYWIRDRVRGNAAGSYGSHHQRRYPAARVIHIFDADMAEQSRGVPWAFSTLRRFEKTRKYEDAELTAADLSAKFFAWEDPGEGAASQGQPGRPPQPNPGPTPTGKVKTQIGSTPPERQVKSGTLYEVESGGSLNFHKPTHPNDAYRDFVASNLQQAAAALGLWATSITGDLSSANFVQSRMGRLAERGTVMMVRSLLIENFCERVYERWLMDALVRGDVPMVPMDELEMASWAGPALEHVQPREQADADHQRLEDGLVSKKELIIISGRDPDEVQADIEAEREAEPEPMPDDEDERAKKGRRRLTDAECEHVRELKAAGATTTELARMVGMSRQAMGKILAGLTYKDSA